MEKMYFGRGIEIPEKSELWHGDIWQRSPLYGDATIFIDNGKTRSMILFGKISAGTPRPTNQKRKTRLAWCWPSEARR